MRLKQLESALSSIQREFPNPNVTLEQYPTSPSLTAAVVLTALERHDIGPGRSVVDLGCGTAMLSIGCALVDTDFVWGVDCDASALERARCNIVEAELDDRIALIQARVVGPSHSTNGGTVSGGGRGGGGPTGRGQGRRGRHAKPHHRPSRGIPLEQSSDTTFPLLDQCVDTVVTNPPFGTKPDKAGIDMAFVYLACRLATRSVYSFHKTSTRDYVRRTLLQAHDRVASVTVVAEMKFDLPHTYKFHQKASVDVAVDLMRIELVGAAARDATIPSVPSANDDQSRESREDSDNDSVDQSHG